MSSEASLRINPQGWPNAGRLEHVDLDRMAWALKVNDWNPMWTRQVKRDRLVAMIDGAQRPPKCAACMDTGRTDWAGFGMDPCACLGAVEQIAAGYYTPACEHVDMAA